MCGGQILAISSHQTAEPLISQEQLVVDTHLNAERSERLFVSERRDRSLPELVLIEIEVHDVVRKLSPVTKTLQFGVAVT